MLRIMYKSKIQKATITETKMDYAGSIGIDSILMEMADILPNEKVQVLNLDTGARFETYVIKEKAGSGTICLYGPAAHLGKAGEKVFIISYCLMEDEQARNVKPKVIYLDEHNRVKEKTKKDG
ncbi:MAG: aspartate 1-decarboxylase [Candidatus Omnitrophica bacterium]|nr:aspartate 1-decarboxylase [Candidatus Omnitrophota bacterium]